MNKSTGGHSTDDSYVRTDEEDAELYDHDPKVRTNTAASFEPRGCRANACQRVSKSNQNNFFWVFF